MAPNNSAKSQLSFAPLLFVDGIPIVKVINIHLLDVNCFFWIAWFLQNAKDEKEGKLFSRSCWCNSMQKKENLKV
jgi:hypothetical protein